MMKITKDMRYVGVNDYEIDLFEGQFVVPKGMAYNSYVILDEKTAVLDTVDIKFGTEWLDNVKKALEGRAPDYLIINHMEPDHSANVRNFVSSYPDVKVVGNFKTFVMLSEFFGEDFAVNKVVVKEGDCLSLGKHELTFVFAPMVHWPEVMVTYDKFDKALYSADAFGKFGASDADEAWDDEARRYYFGIVGKYGAQVEALFKKLSSFEIKAIYPLHGPLLSENISHYLDLYSKWASYTPEISGVMIAYTSVYGHTKEAAELLARELKENGVENVKVCDIARTDFAACIADAFRYNKIVLATTTYNGDIFPAMRKFIDDLTERNFKRRIVGLIENGSWAPMASRVMTERLGKCKELEFTENTVKIRSALNDESRVAIKALADELGK